MLIALLIGVFIVAAAAAASYAVARARLRDAERSLEAEARARTAAEARARELEPELAALRERLTVIGDMKGQIEDRFKLLAGDVLAKSSQSLVDSTKQVLEPLRLSVERVDKLRLKCLELAENNPKMQARLTP